MQNAPIRVLLSKAVDYLFCARYTSIFIRSLQTTINTRRTKNFGRFDALSFKSRFQTDRPYIIIEECRPILLLIPVQCRHKFD